MLKSQVIRQMAPEMDSLRLAMGWTLEDLEKRQIIVGSTFDRSHTGSAHLERLVNAVSKGVDNKNGKPVKFFVTDI